MESMHYRLRCLACGEPCPEQRSGFRLHCDCAAPPRGLLRAEYAERFAPGGDSGVFRYRAWLPVRRSAPPAAPRKPAPGPVAYRSDELARRIGIDRLVGAVLRLLGRSAARTAKPAASRSWKR